jgi:hypothetical protein
LKGEKVAHNQQASTVRVDAHHNARLVEVTLNAYLGGECLGSAKT